MIGSLLTGIGIAAFGFFLQTLTSGLNRKIVAHIQKKHGPKWYQEFLDIFKLINKPSVHHGWIFDFGIIVALGGIIATAMFVPLTNNIVAFYGYYDFAIFIYLFFVGIIGMTISASASSNPLTSIGMMKALKSLLAYEVPFLIVVLTIINLSGENNLSDIAIFQQLDGNNWFIIALPLGALVVIFSLMGLLGKKPCDLYVAPCDSHTGAMIEHGGQELGMLYIMHEIAVFIAISLFVHLFLGGAQNIFAFILKYFIVYTLINLLHVLYKHFEIASKVKFYYKWPLFLAVLQAIVAIYFGLLINF